MKRGLVPFSRARVSFILIENGDLFWLSALPNFTACFESQDGGRAKLGSYFVGVWLSIQLVYSEPGPMNSSCVPIVSAFLCRDCSESRGMKSSGPSVLTSRFNKPLLRGGVGI